MSKVQIRGYEPKTVPTADLVVGDFIYFPGASFHLPIAKIEVQGDESVFYGIYESWGRRRYAVVRRKTAGKSTKHEHVEVA